MFQFGTIIQSANVSDFYFDFFLAHPVSALASYEYYFKT